MGNWAKSSAEKLCKKLGDKNWAKSWVEKLGKKWGGKIGQKIGRILICDHTIIKRLFCAKSWDELMNFIELMNQWTYGPLNKNNT